MTEEPKIVAIRNKLHINTQDGREPFERMCQRTTFGYKWSKGILRAQIMVQNVFYIGDPVIFGNIVKRPGSMFI